MTNGLLILLALAAANSAKGSSTDATDFKGRCVKSKFGTRINPITGKKETHNGIDLNLPANTPLFAPSDVIITKVWNNASGGNMVLYRLKNGVQIGYAHLNQVKVKTGQQLKKGDLIGLSGSTGQVTGAHLHVTVRDRAGNYIDPAPYFRVGNCRA